jgi:hypothetical protein
MIGPPSLLGDLQCLLGHHDRALIATLLVEERDLAV